MSTAVNESGKIGDVVYEPYRPQNYGKIIDVIQNWQLGLTGYRVRWHDGRETTTRQINDLQALVDDHERKLQTHRTALAKARQL